MEDSEGPGRNYLGSCVSTPDWLRSFEALDLSDKTGSTLSELVAGLPPVSRYDLR